MAKVEPGMESMLEMYIFETNTLLEQLDEILLRTEDANVFSQDDINEISESCTRSKAHLR